MSISPLMTKKEVAAVLHTSVWSVEQLISNGSLPVVPVGAREKIRPADVEQYIAENIRKGDQAGPDQEIIVITAYEN
jgi:excisionase family DNA binding protein